MIGELRNRKGTIGQCQNFIVWPLTIESNLMMLAYKPKWAVAKIVVAIIDDEKNIPITKVIKSNKKIIIWMKSVVIEFLNPPKKERERVVKKGRGIPNL